MIERLEAHPLPGNVRELQNIINSLVGLAGPLRQIDLALLDVVLEGAEVAEIEPLSTVVERAERQQILLALRIHKGNVTKAATALGVTRGALWK